MSPLAIELSVYNNSKIDITYELITIMMHLNHDADLTVKEHRFVDDSAYSDCTHGYLLLDFMTYSSYNTAAEVLVFRGYKVAGVST